MKDREVDLPSTLAGWSGFILATLSILVIILGVVVRLAKQHIDSRINKTLEFTIAKAVANGMAAMLARVDSIDLQLVTQDGELARVRRIEEQINNGLMERQVRIEDKVDTIVDHLSWSGNERREGQTP